MKNLTLFTWTNKEYEDVFPAYFGNVEKYFPQIEKSYVAINELSEVISDNHLQLVNEERYSYAARILGCLENVEEEYILYMQEDFILYDSVVFEEIDKCFEYLKTGETSCVKLIRSGSDTLKEKVSDNVYRSCEFLSAVHQATMWNKKHFAEVIENLNPKTLRDFEINGNASHTMRELGYQSTFYFDESSSPRGGHFDSKVFPYIATALMKGKWNTGEYLSEITKLSEDYNIDLNARGCLL